MNPEEIERLVKTPEFQKFKQELAEEIKQTKHEFLTVSPERLTSLQARVEAMTLIYNKY